MTLRSSRSVDYLVAYRVGKAGKRGTQVAYRNRSGGLTGATGLPRHHPPDLPPIRHDVQIPVRPLHQRAIAGGCQ